VSLRRRFKTVLLENVGDGAPCKLAAKIGQRTLDPPVAPAPVLRCQANNQVLNLIAGSGSARATILAPIVLLDDQLPASGQEGFRRDDYRDFPRGRSLILRIGSSSETKGVWQWRDAGEVIDKQ